MRYLISFVVVLMALSSVSAKTKKQRLNSSQKNYNVIYRQTNVSGLKEVGTMKFSTEKQEDRHKSEMTSKLFKEYAAAQKQYKEELKLYKSMEDRSQAEKPKEPRRPRFFIENKKYKGSKELKEMNQDLTKMKLRVEKENEKNFPKEYKKMISKGSEKSASKSSDKKSESGKKKPKSGDKKPESGDEKSESGKKKSKSAKKKSKSGDKKSEA